MTAESAMKQSLKSRLQDKAPEMVLEGVSVVLAVLLALAVDACREDRRNAREAERARQGVLEEIAANHAELTSNTAENRALFEAARQTLAAMKTETEDDDRNLRADFSVSLPSSASWQTAQVTLSVHHLDFAWVSRISKLYELQALYSRRQDDFVDFMASGDDLELAALTKRLTTVMDLHEGLLTAYEEVHPELAAGEPPAAAAAD